MPVRPEASAAAGWWAQQLAAPATRHETGDPDINFVLTMSQAMYPRVFTTEQRDRFRTALEHRIEEFLARDVARGCWNPAQPQFGSAMRTVGVEYGPDQVLAEAAKAAGIELRTWDLPVKTVMWVNPGRVTVACGHQAELVTVWEAPRG